MKAGGGKAKGSSFERLLCKELSLWISDNRKDDLLWRSAMSGGRATVRARKGKMTSHQAGDICAVHPEGHKLTDVFYIEAKAYKDLKAAALLFSCSGTTAKFWGVCKKEAKRHGKFPMMIVRQNQHETMMCLRTEDLDKLRVRRFVRCRFPTLDLCMLGFQHVLSEQPYLAAQGVRPRL